jgi:hypothetical protein
MRVSASAKSSPRTRLTRNTTAPERDAHRGRQSSAAAGSVARNGHSERVPSTAVVYMPAPKNAPWPKEK